MCVCPGAWTENVLNPDARKAAYAHVTKWPGVVGVKKEEEWMTPLLEVYY